MELVPSTIDDLVERPTCAKLDGIKCAPLAEEAIAPSISAVVANDSADRSAVR
jgi:hypothetical protein